MKTSPRKKDQVFGFLDELRASAITLSILCSVDALKFYHTLLTENFPKLRNVLGKIPASKEYYQKGNPMVEIRHGFLTGSTSMNGIIEALKDKYGLRNHQYNFLTNVEDLSDRLIDKLQEVDEITTQERYGVTHSLGALTALRASQKDSALFQKLVTIAIPYYGSLNAFYFPLVSSLWQFRPDSPELALIHQQPLPKEVEILNIYSPYDQIIRPYSNSILPERENITNLCVPLGYYGPLSHNGLIYEKMVHQIIRFFLDEIPFDNKYLDLLSRRMKEKFPQKDYLPCLEALAESNIHLLNQQQQKPKILLAS